MKLKLVIIIFILFSSQSILLAQSELLYTLKTDTLLINFNNVYKLSGIMIKPSSEIIRLKGSPLLPKDYTFSYTTNSFTLSPQLQYSLFDTLIVTYLSINTGLKKEYLRQILTVKLNEKTGDTIKVSQTIADALSPESFFGKDIQKSGTLVRGFTIGTNKDFTLNSGLRLQLSGRLTDDIEIIAALTDENSPIQPEGNTEKLDELDKVFVQVKHPNLTGTFGDYELKKRIGEFGVVDRKLQGLSGDFNYKNYSAFFSVASSKGKFNTNTFAGLEGVQGPYRMSGINNERDIIIIAGSEKVFLDGIEMKRGENNDYIIDYANAQITFTPKKLITSASRISVDFEFTDRRFERSFLSAGTTSKFFNNKLSINMLYVKEGDNKDAPVDFTFTDEDKNILYGAGDDRNRAVRSGISLALPDSNGVIKGTYEKIDTLINDIPFTYYVYNPGSINSLYNLSFSYTGENAGDYIRESIGIFRFAGKSRGNYMPVIFLPMPEQKQLGNIVVEYYPFKEWSVSLEYSGSLYDKNTFSDLNDNNNYGYARNIYTKLTPIEINLGNISLGKIGFSYKDRFVQGRFSTPDRFNAVEFNRTYNISSTGEIDEQLREVSLNLVPFDLLSANTSYGYLKKGEFKSDRLASNIVFTDRKDFNVLYDFDYVATENVTLKSYWFRQKADVFFNFNGIKPGFQFLSEDKKDKINSDSLLPGSLKYFDYAPYLEIKGIFNINFLAKYSLRDDYSLLFNKLLKESYSFTQIYEMNYSGIKEVNSTFNLTYRTKKYKQEFKLRGAIDNETILMRWVNKFNFGAAANGDLFYEVSTQRTAKLQRVFIKVQQGTGNYRYMGDLNNDGVPDENEFEPTIYDGDYLLATIPTEQLYPVIDLKTSTRWKIVFGNFLASPSFMKSILDILSSETFFRIEENTTEEDYKKIYLLNLSAFQNPGKTINGSNLIQQDIFFFENNQELNFRVRYSQRKGMNQFNDGSEFIYNRERSLRIKFKLIEEVNNQTEIINFDDNVDAPESSNRKRKINGNSFISDFSYRPEKNIEVGFKIKAGRNEDKYPEKPTVIDLNSQALRFNLSFAGTGRLRIELERNELISNSQENFLPFELTQGNVIGKNYFVRLNFDYRILSNLQSTISYDGRSLGGSKFIHTARAEVRAYF